MGGASAPESLWQAVTAAQGWIYKVASYSISRSCYYTENYLCHKQVMDESVILYAVLFVVSFVLCEEARSVLTTADRCAVTDLFVSLCLTFSATQRFFLKFFLKCNQNCLKNAGNPRDMRRFQVSTLYIMQTRTAALPGTLCHCCFANH